ncbi:AAA family ATPase [Lachnospiraceae bacterium 48-21]
MMLIFLGVENFAKIERAKVCINSYTILVGPNSSGKTYLMQLVQGVNERLTNLTDEEGLQILKCGENRASNSVTGTNEGCTQYILSQDNILSFTEYLNVKLDEKKEQIVKEVFGREVPVGKLYVDIELEEKESYEIILFDNINNIIGKHDDIDSFIRENIKNTDAYKDVYRIGGTLINYSLASKNGEVISIRMFSENNQEISKVKLLLRYVLESYSLYFPASRTGIMLLFKEFFANKADELFSYQMNGNKLIATNDYYGELTQPIYQYLRFLQTYSEWIVGVQDYEEEIEFFEEKLIEGHITANKQNGFSYDSKTDHVSVPMYMASSMVNEIAPFVLALSSAGMYNGFIIDEIEASLHPQKQLELVRFLNRLSNRGLKLILSTHSDTFVSKVNNLYLLSNYVKQNKQKDVLEKMGLEKEDLMSPDKLFVYEFVSQPNGKSIVKEIPGDSKTGFQFDLFTESAMHLYNEALEIGEILQNAQT